MRTADGSLTFFNQEAGETYHSVTGAFEEAFGKFIAPSGIDRLASRPFVVFDICFGLGYNTAAALHTFLEHATETGFIEIYAFEIDKWIISQAAKINVPESIDGTYFAARALVKHGSVYSDNFSLNLLVGDVRKTLPRLRLRADLVFLDPFSPKHAPDLWQPGFITEVRNHMLPGAVLTTFSCARPVREALRANGFEVSDGPRIGRRGPSTVAKVFK